MMTFFFTPQTCALASRIALEEVMRGRVHFDIKEDGQAE